ncbi:MAG: PD-(D/E)XK nuclease family protein [Armatimonadetes bacterium]|nr:PD-(D/E)XK nuclease family protein [Armatimonadota bacterium]
MTEPITSGILDIHRRYPVLERALQEEAAARGAVLGDRHVLLSDFYERILSGLKETPRRLTRMGQYLLAKGILEHEFADGKSLLGSFLSFRGFVDILIELVNEFQEAALSPEDLKKAIPKMGETREKFAELAIFYAMYRKCLSDFHLWDYEEQKKQVLERLRLSEPIPFLDSLEEIHFRNILSLSRLDFQIILELCRRATRLDQERPSQVFVHLPYDPSRQDASRFLEPVVRKFESTADEFPNLNLEFVIPSGGDPSARDYLLTNLFRKPDGPEPIPPIPSDGTVRLIRASAPEEEVEEMGREIRELLSKGVPVSKIGVVFRSLSLYGQLAIETARKFSLPFTFVQGNPALSSRLVRTLLLPAAILDSRFSAREVLKFLNSGFLDLSAISQESLHPRDLEELVVRAGVIDDESVPWEHGLTRLIHSLADSRKSSEEAEATVQKAESLLHIIRNMKSLFSGFPESAPISVYAARMQLLIRELKVREKVVQFGRGGEAGSHSLDFLQKELSALRSFEDTLDEIVRTSRALPAIGEIFGEASKTETCVGRQDFFDLLMEGLKDRNLAPPSEMEGIMVLDAEELVGLEFDYLFLGGLTEGEFPHRHFEEALFRDEEKEALNLALGEKIFMSTPLKQWKENLLFYRSIASARKVLTLAVSTLDEGGEVALPSQFLESSLKLLEENPEHPLTRVTQQGSVVILCRDELTRLITFLLWRPSEEKSLSMPAALLSGCLARDPDSMLRFADIFKRCEMERMRESPSMATGDALELLSDGRIEAPEILSRMARKWGEDGKWSATQLEDYGKCPFMFFMKHVLRLEKPLFPELDTDPLSEGALFHHILEKYYRKMEDAGLLPLSGKAEEETALREVAQAAFSAWEAERVTGEPHFWEIRKKSVLRTLSLWLNYERKEMEGFTPFLFEADFGRTAPFSIPDRQGGPLYLTGRIDRVDVAACGDAYRVLDYKNSRSESHKEKLRVRNLGKLGFQAPLYALAAEKLLREKGKLTTDAPLRVSGYALLKGPNLVKQDFADPTLADYFKTDPDLRAALPEGGKNLADEICGTISHIRAGRFEPSGQGCEYCDYSQTCRYRSGGESEGG